MRSALHLGSGMFGSYAGTFSEEVMRKRHQGGDFVSFLKSCEQCERLTCGCVSSLGFLRCETREKKEACLNLSISSPVWSDRGFREAAEKPESDHHISVCFAGEWWRAAVWTRLRTPRRLPRPSVRERASSDNTSIVDLRLAEDVDIMCADGINSQ